MGKADQQKTQAGITDEVKQNANSFSSGSGQVQNRINQLTPSSDADKSQIQSGYAGLATGGIDPAEADRLRGTISGNTAGITPNSGNISGGGGGGGGGGGNSVAGPSYLGTFESMLGDTGGFDPGRLSSIEGDADFLRNAGNLYGATNASIGGLQNFAATGGLNDAQLHEMRRDKLLDVEKTGGYTAEDIANERARANAGISGTYANLSDTLNRQRLAGANVGPGLSNQQLALARRGAQDIGTQSQNTEAGIHERVLANELAASGKLADLGLSTAQLQSANTLTGYTNAGNLDIAKNADIENSRNMAGNLDLNTQGLINNTRLSAAGGLSQDTLGRMSIGASSSAANAALALAREQANAGNEKFLISEADQNKQIGNQGLLSLYGTSPSQLMNNQNQLLDWNRYNSSNLSNQIGQRISASTIPGIGSTIGSGLNLAGRIAGIGSGVAGGLGGVLAPTGGLPRYPNSETY